MSEYAWPDVRRICFTDVGSQGLNACVDWVLSRPHDLNPYATGYREAATALFEHAFETGTRVDVLIFPLATLWRHHLELALKAIVATGRQLKGAAWGFDASHNLQLLWREATEYVVECGPRDAPEVANVEAAILEFHSIDPAATGFRYPTKDTRDPMSRSLPDAPKYINVESLHEAMEGVANFLSAVGSELDRQLECVWGLEREMQES